MNRHLKRRRNLSIISLIAGLLIIVFKEYVAIAVFGTTLIATFPVIMVGYLLFGLGVASLARLYFYGDI